MKKRGMKKPGKVPKSPMESNDPMAGITQDGAAKLKWHKAIQDATDASAISELTGKFPHQSVVGMGPAIGGKPKGFKPEVGPAI